MNETTNGKAVADKWPTASGVAARLGCLRQQVYRLEKRGKLSAHETRGGAKRYDPAKVAELEEADDELERLLASEVMTDDEDDEEGPPPNVMRLAGGVVKESRLMALEARKGLHEAYDLIATPTRELVKLQAQMLTDARARISELETRLNQFHDEQRDARRDDREAAFVQQRMQREDDRKDAFFRMFVDNLPVVIEQMRPGGANSKLLEYLKNCSPEKQSRIIMTLETVMGDDPEPSPPVVTEAETPAPATAQKDETT